MSSANRTVDLRGLRRLLEIGLATSYSLSLCLVNQNGKCVTTFFLVLNRYPVDLATF